MKEQAKLGLPDFSGCAAEIHRAFQDLFGTTWQEAAYFRAVLESSPVALAPGDVRGAELVRQAYRLRDRMIEFLARDDVDPRRWSYFGRLVEALAVHNEFMTGAEGSGQALMRMEVPPFALRTMSVSDYWTSERRRIVLWLARHFRSRWDEYLPDYRRSGETRRRQSKTTRPNVLTRGIAAALVLGGWLLEQRTRTAKTGAQRFGAMVTTVKQDLARLGADGKLEREDLAVLKGQSRLEVRVVVGHRRSGRASRRNDE